MVCTVSIQCSTTSLRFQYPRICRAHQTAVRGCGHLYNDASRLVEDPDSYRI